MDSEKKVGLWFFAGLIVIGGIWYLTASKPLSGRVGAIGGTIALFGVILIARPVLRYGVFRFIAVTTWSTIEGFSKIDLYDRVPESQRAEIQASDTILQQVFGPGLVGIGTAISAFAGLA